MNVIFDAKEFREAFPKFTENVITDAQLLQCFDVACLVLDNTERSSVPYDPSCGVLARKTLLYLLVCHLATLALRPAGQSGAIASASEGSVSTSFVLPQLGRGAAWYQQTPCGQTFWAAAAPYRTGLLSYKPCGVHPWG